MLASAVRPGDKVAPGDLISTRRSFGSWTLICDILLGRRRVCLIEGRAVGDDGAPVTVRLANTEDMQLAVSVVGPGDLGADKGVSVELGAGVTRQIEDVRCITGVCGVQWLADREFGAALSSAEALRIGYVRGGARHNADISTTLFREAVAAVGKPDVGAPIVATKGELGLGVAEPVDVEPARPPSGEIKRASPRKAQTAVHRPNAVQSREASP